MRIRLAIILSASLLMAIPLALASESTEKNDPKNSTAQRIYEIKWDKDKKASIFSKHPNTGESRWFLGLHFDVIPADPNSELNYQSNHWIAIKEDGKVRDLLPLRKESDHTIILAMDMGGSMREGGKIAQARTAANVFLDMLKENAYADPGFIQFNENILQRIPPLGHRDPGQQESHRQKIRQAKEEGEPRGGTGYLNATLEAVKMLEKAQGKKSVVIITDGLDPDSKQKLQHVIEAAKNANVQVYTIGVGASGRGNACVLVLDRSGSMSRPATEKETKTKMAALYAAACKFVDILRSEVPISIQAFSTIVEPARPFTDNKAELKEAILSLQPSGGTQLYDAMYAGIMSLAAAYPDHNRRLIVMTDGVDEAPGSRHRYEEVIEAAKRENVRLHLVGFGRKGEINETVMQQMAKETQGTYTHADSAAALEKFFGDQALESSQQGIDVASLTELAVGTRGKYHSAEDVNALSEVMRSVTKTADQSFHPLVPCREGHDGMVRGIEIDVLEVTRCQLTDQSVNSLRTARVPDSIIDKVTPLKDKVFETSEGYTGELRKRLAKDELDKYQDSLVKYAIDVGSGKQLADTVKKQARTHGVVPPGINWRSYLLLLALIGAFLIVPAFFRRVARLGGAA